jgi:anaerobic magnesium-protoporphyrin IX monomethyl ester cyclase
MKVLLIAGLGPGHLENEDLRGSYMDSSLSKEIIDSEYILNGVNYSLNKLTYKSKDNNEKLLREDKQVIPELISSVLQNILKDNNIDHEFIPISNIWENKQLKQSTDIVCLSTSFMWSDGMLDYALNWIIKNITYTSFILGGQYSALKTEYLLNKYNFVDYIITGDAELSLSPLIKFIKQNKPLSELSTIPNIAYKDQDKKKLFTYIDTGKIEDYKTCSFKGDFHTVPYTSMKGCPYSCKFCALRVSTPKWRFLSAERIIQDWKMYMHQNNTKHIDVNDSTFFIPFSKIKLLLELLPDMNITWEANIRADTPLDETIVKKLEDAHCLALYFGFESLSDEVLQYMDKKTTSEDNKRINNLFKKSQINTMMSFIVGYPGETPEEHEKTRQYLINEHFGNYNIYVFEFENESMPIWKDKDKFILKIFEDKTPTYSWQHGGEFWEHIGMNSTTAKMLRKETIKKVRLSNSRAIHRTWQYKFQWPFIASLSRQENLQIEKSIDRLVFVAVDYPDKQERTEKIEKIMNELKKFNISME